MKKHWRDEWDDHAEHDRQAMDLIPVDHLLDYICSGQFGNYYVIWYSIAERATLEQAGWILFDILNTNIDYLYRYHCAAALLWMLKSTEITPVQLSSLHHNMVENLKVVRAALEKAIGMHP